jgi:PTS system mannose-specific IIA component
LIHVLVMTHGMMAEGVCDSAQMILGRQEELSYLSFKPDWSLDTLASQLRERLSGFGENAKVLVLADLFGGTPSNALATLMGEGSDIAAVAGVNLPMLIEVLMSREDYEDPAVLAEDACNTGVQGIVDIGELLAE